jgi:outer membrane protein TolC
VIARGRIEDDAVSRRLRGPAPFIVVMLLLALGGCGEVSSLPLLHPSVAPATQPGASLKVDASKIPPMYHRLLAVDLRTVLRVATARNIDIKEAKERVEGSRGEYESSIGALFPSLTPSVTAMGIEGALSSHLGHVSSLYDIVPIVALQWVINPGQVAYDLIASKRRLEASTQQQQAVTQETLRIAAVRYYDLVLAQAKVSVAHEAMDEAGELLRIETLRLKTGTGLPADELRAEAALAGTRQDLLNALNGFYNASLSLTVTLHLDPTVMLVPRAGTMLQTTLVRNDLPIDDMLTTAVRYRPDLAAVRTLLASARAEKGATIWGGLGPQGAAARNFGPSPPSETAVDTLYRQRTYVASAGFNWSASTFGRIKSAVAGVKIAGLDLERKLDRVQAAVVVAHQGSITAAQLIPIAAQQVASAEEALRLTQENLKAGTGLTVDVLQAEGAADQARARYATAIVHYNQSQIDLLAALGLIDPGSIEERGLSSSRGPASGTRPRPAAK